MNTNLLLSISIILLIVSSAVMKVTKNKTTTSMKIISGISKTLFLTGWAMFFSSIITFLLPVFQTLNIEPLNINELNNYISKTNNILKWSWMLTLLVCMTIILCAWLTQIQISKVIVEKEKKLFKYISIMKGVFSILAFFTFVGGDLHGQLTRNIERANNGKVWIHEAQLQITNKTEAFILHKVLASTISSLSQENKSVNTTLIAYSNVSKVIIPPINDLVAPENLSNPQPGALPDLSLVQLKEVEQVIDKAKTEGQEMIIVEQIADILYDKSISNPIKGYLFEFQNPILSGIVNAIADPVLFNPLKNKVTAIALSFLQKKIDIQTVFQQTHDEGVQQSKAISMIIDAHITEPTFNEQFGQEDWDRVRINMAKGVEKGLPGKSSAIQNKTRDMEGRFLDFRNNMQILSRNSTQKNILQETGFTHYLNKNPDFAALWGYAVIAFTPSRLQAELKGIATQDIQKDIIPSIKLLASDPSNDAQQALENIGLSSETVKKLNDQELTSAIYSIRGTHPADGYELYFSDVAPSKREDAKSYFESTDVVKNVTIYCPRTH
ncbi:hypothetical protein [Citrobacter amalonaticus]|uniref:hypothetical protein n=1 Tax=Citrobacter amalonaticus TaxID=35703 RepID=UPI001A3353B6|nr:hypothetical protein [Citrobacter amalonaticus]HDQ2814135.1 hypothetical protein [Citrobacter amalonaticus]